MLSIPLKESSNTINVPFHGTDLYVVNYNGEPYVPMKPIVEGMGLAWGAQFVKLKQRFSKGVSEIEIPTKTGNQDMTCLALRKLAGWLATISPNKVKASIREKVIRYQDECDDVLYEYWTTGEVKAKAPVKQPPNFRYIINMEVYDTTLNKTEVFTGGTETPREIVSGVAKRYGYYIENMLSLPINAF
ncbi:phage antirepressor N-terminal domain-containing protein [Xenorhabdus sp. XENO-2]|uniref:Phage antirepressor N-terminal domain-containing protein n=1 Tax=Xenorhabdus anantnagensis TaxID=3025875 RepID=A0ABT5LYU1_9GAMM|nr:phage antirepressor N-terminal domain-containing protein [Xenorhabdus anantnagensis]